ncbi:MAG: hypothetical protein PHS41_07085 [Victivallaceae bacterium]|nr:hypothetical protein [Victivallaceae bacterium]
MVNSYGHMVPVADGQLQEACDEFTQRKIRYYGTVLTHEFTRERSRIVLDLKSAYPKSAGLTELKRTFELDHASGRLTIRDAFAFDRPRAFENALISYQEFQKRPDGGFDIGGIATATITGPDKNLLKFDCSKLKAKVLIHKTQPNRLGIRLSAPAQQGTLAITITPNHSKEDTK